MISLKDQIKRFQNMVYNKELAQFVTVDQMFVGGGITIESMIHQSNFVVEELKKMNAVFLNYCKLNQKVYNKIAEHEINLHNQHGKMNGLVNAVDRKVGETVKTLKELHESTVNENSKSIKMIENVTQPLKKQLQKKVDKVTFESQMKKFLQEYDEGGLENENQSLEGGQQRIAAQLSNGQGNGQVGGGNTSISQTGLASDGLPLIKKKGKVGYEDFYKFQADTHARMKQVNLKLQQTSGAAFQGKQLIFKYIPIINKTTTDVSLHTSEIYRISNETTTYQNQSEASINKILSQLNYRTNDQMWNTKFDLFYDKSMRPIINEIESNIRVNKLQIKQQREDLQIKMININEEISKIKETTRDLDQNLKKNTKDILSSNSQIKTNHDQFCKERHKTDKQIESLKLDISKRIQTLQKQSKSQIQQLKSTLENLMQTIGQTVFKTVNKKVESQLKVIESQIRANRDKIKGIKNDVGSICEQIRNMKEILSKKANYTDIIHHVQKKADKEDFKDFQLRIHESSQQFVSKNLNQSIVLTKGENDKNRSSSLSRANKTLFAPRSSPNRLNKTDFDVSTKLFMCGMQGHLGEGKSNLSQKTRRRSIKSSTAVISDFTA